MWEWLKKRFGSKTPVVEPAKEVLYCREDGELLVVAKEVLDYNPYTGLPSSFWTKKTCPKCGTLAEKEFVKLAY